MSELRSNFYAQIEYNGKPWFPVIYLCHNRLLLDYFSSLKIIQVINVHYKKLEHTYK